MATIGLITDYGQDQSIKAQNEKGFFILPKSFGVCSTAGPWTKARTPADNPTPWYRATISSARQVGPNTVEVVCTVPPNAAATSHQFREIQIFCEDTNGVEFFYGFGQPGNPPTQVAPVTWYPADILEIRLQFVIAPLDAQQVFEFQYSQAQEIADHNLAQDAHPEILRLLARNGIFMFQSDLVYGGQWIDCYPSYNTANIGQGDWVYLNDDGFYYKAQADRTNKQKSPGMMDLTQDRARVIYGGLMQIDLGAGNDLPQGQTIYLSATELGKATATRSSRPLGTSLGGGNYLISSGVGSGGGDSHISIQDDYLAGPGDAIHVWFPDGVDEITITLPEADTTGDVVKVLDPGQACSLGGKQIRVNGNGKGIDDAEVGDEDDYIIDIPGAFVAFIYDDENKSWAIDLGGRVDPFMAANINVYYWDLVSLGSATVSVKQREYNADLPKDANPYHYLVQVEDITLCPSQYTIDPDLNQIVFNTAPTSGDEIVIRYVGSSATVDGCPVGMIAPFPRYGEVSKGWIVCDGGSFDPVVFPDLYDKLGEAVVPLVNTDPEAFLVYFIKAYDDQIDTGHMNALLGVPVGFESMWPGTTAPEGWLDETQDLGLLERSLYPTLWDFISTSGNVINDATWLSTKGSAGVVNSFSSGDTTTTFRIPFKAKAASRLPIIKAYDTAANASLVNIQTLIDGLAGKVDKSSWVTLVPNAAYKMPNGLIIQMGSIGVPAGEGTLVFPVAFPSACLYLGGTDLTNSAIAVNVCYVGFGPRAVSQVPVYTVRGSSTGPVLTPDTVFWLAIGY